MNSGYFFPVGNSEMISNERFVGKMGLSKIPRRKDIAPYHVPKHGVSPNNTPLPHPNSSTMIKKRHQKKWFHN